MDGVDPLIRLNSRPEHFQDLIRRRRSARLASKKGQERENLLADHVPRDLSTVNSKRKWAKILELDWRRESPDERIAPDLS